MPFKLEFHTLTGPYVTTAPEDCKDPIKWAMDKLFKNESFTLDDGSLWHAYNTQLITAVIQAPDFPAIEDNLGDDFKTEQEAPKPKPWQGATGNIHAWKEKVNYTGTHYNIVVLSTWDADSRAYFLLFTINGAAARDMISDSGQAKMVAAWLEQNYGGYKGQYEVVVPHGTIYDQEEAENYLKDYVRETAPEHKPAEKTGKAWQGWNEDRGYV